MKKFLTVLLSAMALVVGSFAFSAPATAAPYPGTVTVKCNAKSVHGQYTRAQHARVKFVCSPTEGAGRPSGNVFITIRARGYHKVIHRKLTGGSDTYTMPRLRGTRHGFTAKTYRLKLRYVAPNGSVYMNDVARTSFKIKAWRR